MTGGHSTAGSIWDDVDDYFAEHLAPSDEALDAALAACVDAGLPPISVTPLQGKLLYLLAQMCGARRILEIGTLGGYSTIWLGRAMAPDGQLITLEIDPARADIARRNIARAGLGERVEILVAPAAESLARLEAEHVEPFDFAFIDADKASSAVYVDAVIRLSRSGTVIVVDNVVRDGAVVDAATENVDVQGIRALVDLLARESRVSGTAIQTVGNKGYDGFILATVTAAV